MSRARDLASYIATGVTAAEFDALDGITVNATNMNSTVLAYTDTSTDFNCDADTFVIDKSENKVGILKSDPSTALDVTGTVTATAFAGPLTGNVAGNTSGTAATVTGAAQSAIESVGTLTGLTVNGAVVFNENSADVDFRVESDGNANALFVEGSSGNVGFGTNTPSIKLHCISDSTSDSFAFQESDGNWVGFFVDTDPALMWKNSGDLRIATAANVNAGTFSEKMRITSAGNVGIGKYSSLGAVLDVEKTTAGQRIGQFTGGASNNETVVAIRSHNTGFSDTALMVQGHGTGGALCNMTHSNSSSSVSAFYVKGDGNVGIGTTSPDVELQVEGSLSLPNDKYIYFDDSSGVIRNAISKTSDELRFWSHPTGDSTKHGTMKFKVGVGGGSTVDAMTIDQTGNVGIGITDPGATFHSKGKTSYSGWGHTLGVFESTDTTGQLVFTGSSGIEGGIQFTSTAFSLLAGDGTNAISILNGGNVGIGATSPTDGKLRVVNDTPGDYGIQLTQNEDVIGLHVKQDGANNGFYLDHNGAGATAMIVEATGSGAEWCAAFENLSSSGSGVFIKNGSGNYNNILCQGAGGGNTMYVQADGTCWVSEPWDETSDRALKENIEYIATSGSDVIDALKPCKFDFIDGKKDQYGFIGQEVELVIPEAIRINHQDNDMLAMKTSFIIPWLVKALQEANSRISALENA